MMSDLCGLNDLHMKGETMKRSFFSTAVILLFAVLMITSCASRDKGPAEVAFKVAEEAVNNAKAEAAKIVPDQVAALESALASTKDKLAKADFKTVLTESPALVSKAKDVVAAAKVKKDEFTQQWADLSQGLPEMVEAIESHVNVLSQAKELPANMTAEKLEEAKSGLASIKEEWAKAQESFNSGNLADAISVVTSVKEKTLKAVEGLEMPVPEAKK